MGLVAVRESLDGADWVTGSGLGFDEITENDVVLVRSGAVVHGESEPNEEYAMAVELLALRPDLMAVTHVHSLDATVPIEGPLSRGLPHRCARDCPRLFLRCGERSRLRQRVRSFDG